MERIVREVWGEKGSPPCEWIAREENGVWKNNPVIGQIAHAAIERAYPALPPTWYPPRLGAQDELLSPYQGAALWDFTVAAVMKVVCEFVPVT